MRAVARSLDANIEKTVVKAAVVVDQVAVQTTPVDTGRARGNWRVQIGAPNVDADEDDFDPDGSVTAAEGAAVASTWKIGDAPIYISNNVRYITFLDQGSSAQAPNGISALAVQAGLDVFRRARVLGGVR